MIFILSGIQRLTKAGFTVTTRDIVEISDDNREKLQAMELFKDAHTWSTLIEGTKLADNFHFPMK